MIKKTTIQKNRMGKRGSLKSNEPERILDIYQNMPEFFAGQYKVIRKFERTANSPEELTLIGSSLFQTKTVNLEELMFKELKAKCPDSYQVKVEETKTCYIITEEVTRPS